MRPRVEALVEQGTEGEVAVLAPAVGLLSDSPAVGDIVVAGGRVGRLTTLGRTVELTRPAGASGRVVERGPANHRDPVAYGQLLLRLVPVTSLDAVAGGPSEAGQGAHGLPDGSFAVLSPTHGMFYRRGRPDAPPYVEVGQIVEEGTTLALVEVMKCFSAITYGGGTLPPRAELVEVRAADGAEVHADQVLFVVRAG